MNPQTGENWPTLRIKIPPGASFRIFRVKDFVCETEPYFGTKQSEFSVPWLPEGMTPDAEHGWDDQRDVIVERDMVPVKMRLSLQTTLAAGGEVNLYGLFPPPAPDRLPEPSTPPQPITLTIPQPEAPKDEAKAPEPAPVYAPLPQSRTVGLPSLPGDNPQPTVKPDIEADIAAVPRDRAATTICTFTNPLPIQADVRESVERIKAELAEILKRVEALGELKQ